MRVQDICIFCKKKRKKRGGVKAELKCLHPEGSPASPVEKRLVGGGRKDLLKASGITIVGGRCSPPLVPAIRGCCQEFSCSSSDMLKPHWQEEARLLLKSSR